MHDEHLDFRPGSYDPLAGWDNAWQPSIGQIGLHAPVDILTQEQMNQRSRYADSIKVNYQISTKVHAKYPDFKAHKAHLRLFSTCCQYSTYAK
jgi:hypothetical protein